MLLKTAFYRLLAKSLSSTILKGDRFTELSHSGKLLEPHLKGRAVHLGKETRYLILNGTIHHEQDIQGELERLRTQVAPTTRLIVIYYNSMWRPLLALATWLGLRGKWDQGNWLEHGDVNNFLRVSGWRRTRLDHRLLCPVPIPLVAWFLNRWIAPLPFFNLFTLAQVVIARPDISRHHGAEPPSVSVIIPARNEAGNITEVPRRLPKMGPDDEVIFIEGNSTDNTWEVIQEVARKMCEQGRNARYAQQDGVGKGDAVRKGFAMASKDIVLILDADLTVMPEDLPRFYRVILENRGEYINGSRLVYKMEGGAMRFLNMIGNKSFALAFSFLLGQRYKDTLCGTKVLWREDYEHLASHRDYFGNFDPFGDFDIIFGAARMGLETLEVPIRYRERVYGTTNIQRWRHGWMLLKMLIVASRKLRFIG